jgi:hypothetical protein
VTDAPTPVPQRPSDAEREWVLRALRDGSLEGRLSLDSFSSRVERAYGAESRDQLGALVGDLPPRSRLQRLLAAAAGAASTLSAAVEAGWREPRTPRLALPRVRSQLTIGRALECDCVLADPTVSRRHARLRRRDDRWVLADLGSTNGTRLNGWRVAEEVELRAGDRVSFGTARFRVGDDR